MVLACLVEKPLFLLGTSLIWKTLPSSVRDTRPMCTPSGAFEQRRVGNADQFLQVCAPRNSVQRTQGWLVTLSAPQTGQPKLDATNLGVATTCLAPLFCRKRTVWFSQTETRLFVDFSACHGCTAFKKEKQAAFRFARLSEPYRLRLTHSLRKFGDYCNDSGVSLSRVPRSAVLADRFLSSFVLKAHANMQTCCLGLPSLVPRIAGAFAGDLGQCQDMAGEDRGQAPATTPCS